DRETARTKLIAALEASEVAGIETNRAYLAQVLAYPDFVEGRQITRMLEGFHYRPASIDVLEPGVQSSIQDWPGRTGYWDVGVPPSGPMDALSMRLANRLVGNPEGTAALELTAAGPTLKFNCDSLIALGGAAMTAKLDGEALANWRAYPVKAGSVLQLGRVEGAGLRTYLAVAGGFQVPDYLGSKSTFSLGQFGGHGGRTLRVGDVLHIVPTNDGLDVPPFPKGGQGGFSNVRTSATTSEIPPSPPLTKGGDTALRPDLQPLFTHAWEIGVLYGPHGAPDFFTAEDIDTFFATAWEVHYNSSRTGVRLIGPKPHWARSDGGEAGLHPSNIHDNAYAIGAIDFTGDMPVILGPDGPSLGGFVCPATIVQAELWKLGQLKPGDSVRFKRLTREQANRMQREQDGATASLAEPAFATLPAEHAPLATPVLRHLATEGEKPDLVIRQSGDANILIELGPLVLDMELRFRIQALMEAVKAAAIPGVLDLTPGIRSLQVHFDPRAVDQDTLLDAMVALEEGLPPLDDMEVPSRIVHLPLSWDDPATKLAIEKYMQSVRPDAPWCPSNIEFIRRINGLDSIEDVFNIVFKASYVVMGLGDVYLGAPVATPLDPRHRLVTTKYNPARTWTPENAVGIGGAYMCVYGMEGPGGYQFVGRTVQMWNRHRRTADFTQPWLLRFFDQVRFYPVGQDELLKLREEFVSGRFKLKIEPDCFRLRDYRQFLADNADSITAFKTGQQAAFDAERERWKAAGQDVVASDVTVAEAGPDSELDLPENARPVASHVAGSVWKIEAKVGDTVKAGQALVIVESMKMEFTLVAPCDGTLTHLFCKEGGSVSAGQDLLVLEEGRHEQ
ncbi:MAG: 5-oxoprolinase/urea amidolyase family protein, partial [Gallionellaceae bacterium]|nr:5-oxoprolinase/urea amidolyase family protein [Gallionellaceae bacterium]